MQLGPDLQGRVATSRSADPVLESQISNPCNFGIKEAIALKFAQHSCPDRAAELCKFQGNIFFYSKVTWICDSSTGSAERFVATGPWIQDVIQASISDVNPICSY